MDVTIPAGTRVCSWVVSVDTVNSTARVQPEIDFKQNILGVVVIDDTSFLNLPGINYAPQHGIGRSDSLETIGANFRGDFLEPGNTVDHLRILTDCS